MSRFLRLTDCILNTHHISRILILPNKYKILLTNHGTDGFLIGGSGVCKGAMDTLMICGEKQPTDYKHVSDWIHSLPTERT